MTPPACLCGHPLMHHETGQGPEPCSPLLHRACGCTGYRHDPRTRQRGERVTAEETAARAET